MPTIQGVYTALATPFLADGEIDWVAFEKLVGRQISAGVSGIVISGTTGESPTLSVTEKLSLIRKCRAIAKNQIQIMAGTGGNCTNQSIELSRLAVDAGADSLLIVTPPYNKPSIAGLRLHFSSIAKSVKVPLCLYHVPSRTGQLLNAEQLADLTTIPGVQSVKEASGDVVLFARLRMSSKATILSGDDYIFLPSLAVGGFGIISVVTNVFPEAFIEMSAAFRRGDMKTAQRYHDVLLPFIDCLFSESNPGPLKAALAHEGLCANILRAPLAPVTPSTQLRVTQVLEQTRQELKGIA